MATAEFSKFAGILSAALSQNHLSGFEIAQLEFHHLPPLALLVVMLVQKKKIYMYISISIKLFNFSKFYQFYRLSEVLTPIYRPKMIVQITLCMPFL